jgi:hypothetical protein
MSERSLINEDGVLVTTRRFVTGGTTFQVRTITSVRSKYSRPSKVPTFIFAAVAVPSIAMGFLAEQGGAGMVCFLFGGALLLAALVMNGLRPTGELFVTTSAVEQRALRGSEDQIRRVEEALNDAIGQHE